MDTLAWYNAIAKAIIDDGTTYSVGDCSILKSANQPGVYAIQLMANNDVVVEIELTSDIKAITMFVDIAVLQTIKFNCVQLQPDSVDSLGRQITYSNTGMGKAVKAYEDCPFITLEKEDATTIFQFLKEIVDKHEGDDVKALGDSVSLAYERLIDRLDGLIY